MATAESRSEDTRWDLSDLCASADEARSGWTSLVARAQDFAARYRGTIASLDAAGMRAMLDEADGIGEDLSRLQVYTFLRLSMDATDVEANDLTTIGRDRGADIENETLFFGLEWIALDDDAAEALLASVELAPYAHKLRVERDEKPYVLSELEEQALNARRPVVSSWQSLHDRQVSTLEVPFDSGDGERAHTVSELLSCLYRTDRGLRLKAVEALFAGLEPRADVLAACYDALVGDRLTVDRLRGFENPMRPTNMGNELDDEIVEAMLTATEESYGIGRKWFEAKARVLGLDKLELADQYAPIGEARAFSWPEAVEVVDTAFGRFSPRLAEIFRSCLEAGHVDAYPRPAKGPGAYCTAVSKEILPYVLLNYTNRLRDVSTLAHEFGHATHNVLSLEQQTWRSHRCGIPLAEVPSTFAQSLADDYLLENESDAGTRASLAADRLENAMAAIYRQVVLARFEQRAYGVRGDGLALGTERLNELWIEENAKYYGDSLALPEGYAFGWSYIPHFIHVRFYTYAYSFAQLVALLLYRRYREDPQAFVPKYLELLGAGGSASPADLVAPFGLDLTSTDTWREAFAELDAMRVEAENLSGA
ncbi:MAG: oligoendopeptidase [Gaiellaceae bacterium]|jgi:oligoendopeptidase F|nr:oligoendopeptidase [Gaiellaceae bacterium]MDX6473061.1 oligoendopeptidase [Gaiellaceae bacterium]